jgi:hypothetical protein
VDYAKEIRASMIIMGSHGRTGFRRLMLGSIAERTLRYAECPVLIVKNNALGSSAKPSVNCLFNSNDHRSTAPVTRVYLMKAIAGRPPITNEKPVDAMKKKDAGAVPCILSFIFARSCEC